MRIGEKTPMISRVNVTSEHGTVYSGADEVDETKNWFSRRFCLLFIFSFIILVLAMAIVIIVILMITQLRAASLNANNSMRDSKLQFEELAKRLSEPLEKLNPALEKLQNLQHPGFQQTQLPAPTTLPGVKPIDPIIVEKATTPEAPRRSPNPRPEWKGCENVGKCRLDGYEKPPLVILSLDGFAREYLDRKIVQTFEHISKCGVKAASVYPSYPSKTFPNHYSIVTGLYPESHGIVDNSVFDPSISPVLESMKSTKYAKYYGGEPIWSFYKRKTGNRANCLFWVGCYYNSTGYPPDVSPPYNGDLPFRNRVEQVVSWLKEPEATRPGLINAYMNEPDSAGHYQVDEDDVDRKLAELDDMLDYMMSELNEHGLLECINLVILSDHGMQVLDETLYYEDYLGKGRPIVGASGVVGRIHINDTYTTLSDITNDFTCKLPDVKTNTRKDMPTRKHYSANKRVGDVVLEGRPGITFYNNRKEDYHLSADHGYDFFHNKMHTVFFARGAAFKQNVTVSSFQNVQYMNLWMELLGVDEKDFLKTNGTIGFFDDVLTKPKQRENFGNVVGECPISGVPNVIKCSGDITNSKLQDLSTKLLNCQFRPHVLPLFSNDYCHQNYCDNNLIIAKNRIGLIEMLNSKIDEKSDVEGTIQSAKYGPTCPSSIGNISLAVNQDREFSNIARAHLDLPMYFEEKVWQPLQNLTRSYLEEYEKLYVITGTAVDIDHDGVGQEVDHDPTHLYRIILTCSSSWLSENPPLCDSFENTKILSFIFPIVDSPNTWECMTPSAILTDHLSTIVDVERMTGLKFQISAYSPNQNVKLRTNITTKLW